MSTEREKLFEELFEIAAKYNMELTNSPAMHPGVPEIGDFCGDVEAAVLAAGYRKPQQVTTAEELDALPGFTVVQMAGRDGLVCQKRYGHWALMGFDERCATPQMVGYLPATVLHVGGAE